MVPGVGIFLWVWLRQEGSSRTASWDGEVPVWGLPECGQGEEASTFLLSPFWKVVEPLVGEPDAWLGQQFVPGGTPLLWFEE